MVSEQTSKMAKEREIDRGGWICDVWFTIFSVLGSSPFLSDGKITSKTLSFNVVPSVQYIRWPAISKRESLNHVFTSYSRIAVDEMPQM